jgi:hypothetical protein
VRERERGSTLYGETEGKRMSDKERAVNHERERENTLYREIEGKRMKRRVTKSERMKQTVK